MRGWRAGDWVAKVRRLMLAVVRPLTAGGKNVLPTSSRDGKLLAFAAGASDTLERCTRSVATRPGYIDWSDLACGPGGDFGYTAAVTRELDGATPLPARRLPGVRLFAEGDRYPTPSPAGTRIAFTKAASGPSTILIAAATGGGRRVVTSGYQPDWQPLP